MKMIIGFTTHGSLKHKDAVLYIIDRINYTVQISSAKTGFNLQSIEYDKLFDSDIEKDKCNKITDQEFKLYFIYNMIKKSYGQYEYNETFSKQCEELYNGKPLSKDS